MSKQTKEERDEDNVAYRLREHQDVDATEGTWKTNVAGNIIQA